MGVGARFFVIKSDDAFERWSQARFNRIWDQGERAAFEFISTAAQIGDVRIFMRTLPDVLSRCPPQGRSARVY